MTGDKLDRTLAIRVSQADAKRLAEVAAGFPDFVTERALARVAMRLGLDAIERDPSLLLSTPIPKRDGARKPPRGARRAGDPSKKKK